mgnify:CR=1 FL=1
MIMKIMNDIGWRSCVVLAALGLIMPLAAGTEPAAPVDAGMTAVRMLDFSGGAEKFKEVIAVADPDTETWEKAVLGYAVCLHRRQPDTKADKESAAEYYEEIIERGSGSVYCRLALLFRGKLADRIDYFGDEPRPMQAVEYYTRLLDDYPDSELAAYAALYRAQSQAFAMAPEKSRRAIDALKVWLEKHPDNPLAAVQWMLIADISYYPLKDYANAAKSMIMAEKAGLPSSVLLDEFWWKTANFALLAGDTGLARAYLEKIIGLDASGFIAPARDKLEQNRERTK